MFKRNKSRLIISVLAICVSLSLVGTGFSLWVFISPETGTVAEAKLPLTVSAETKNGTFDSRSLSSDVGPLKIALQGYVFPKMLIFDEGKRGGNPLAQGLSFYKIVRNLNKKGEEHLFVPESPEFEMEHYLDNKVRVTFYREASQTIEELNASGLSLKLSVAITISQKLSKYVTLFDTLKFDEFPTQEQLKNPTTPLRYVFDFTEDAALDSKMPTATGLDYENNIKTSLGFKPEQTVTESLFSPKAIEKSQTYDKYNYIMNFSHIFRWVSMDCKPLTVQSYRNILELVKNDKESLSFSFKAEYVNKG